MTAGSSGTSPSSPSTYSEQSTTPNRGRDELANSLRGLRLRDLPGSLASNFNRSGFGRFLNSPAGRVFRLAGGTCFLVLGIWLGTTPAGLAALIWGGLAISAGGLGVCYISASLGGPFRGAACRAAEASPRG
jgi:hypothetical protein